MSADCASNTGALRFLIGNLQARCTGCGYCCVPYLYKRIAEEMF
jgi:hypothetical protein